MVKHKKDDIVHVVIDNEWDLSVYQGKVLEVRDCDKYLVILDIRVDKTYTNAYTKKEFVNKENIFKERDRAEEYRSKLEREEIERYKGDMEDVKGLIDFCLVYDLTNEYHTRKRLARIAVIERVKELGI